MRYGLLVIGVVGMLTGNWLRADPPSPIAPFIVTADPNGTTTWSWTTVEYVSSGPTYDLYMVTVNTAVVYSDTGEVLSFDSYSYPVLDGGGNDHDAQ
ncbi:MAG: hypothetical protein HYV95_09730 [Opitutae bacterium]|nr:hypothetical protein [Opitutae bacterium]